ncbi:MAG: GNAT family N-acetyltransferase [Gammaproteobacteria bacterium]
MSDYEVTHVPDSSRFEATVDGSTGVLDYRVDGRTVYMNYVGVPPEIGGRGVAGALTSAAVAWAREEGLAVEARCPYVAAWMRRHPEA